MCDRRLFTVAVWMLVAHFSLGSLLWPTVFQARRTSATAASSASDAQAVAKVGSTERSQPSDHSFAALPLEHEPLAPVSFPLDDDTNRPLNQSPEETSDVSLDEFIFHGYRGVCLTSFDQGTPRPVEPALLYSLHACNDLLRPPRA